MLLSSDLREDLFVCRKCGYHFKVTARQRIRILTDRNSFQEHDNDLESANLIDFPGYDKKLEKAKKDQRGKGIRGLGHRENRRQPLCALRHGQQLYGRQHGNHYRGKDFPCL